MQCSSTPGRRRRWQQRYRCLLLLLFFLQHKEEEEGDNNVAAVAFFPTLQHNKTSAAAQHCLLRYAALECSHRLLLSAVELRCTRYVALHILCSVAPQQKEEGDGSCRRLLHGATLQRRSTPGRKRQRHLPSPSSSSFFLATQRRRRRRRR